MRTGTAIKLDAWHVSIVGNSRCLFIVSDIPTSYTVCVCIYILNYLEYSMNTLLVYTMYSCFLAFDPDTSHVHRPIPNHVESIVSDFEV